MEYSFSVQHAIKYGVEESIVIKNMLFWIIKNRANDQNLFDGRTWTYNSIKVFGKLFPFWSGKQIRRILESLVTQGVLVTGNYNKAGYDRTLWYAFSDESILLNEEIDLPKWENRNAQMGKPIPDNKPDIKPDSKPYNTDVVKCAEYLYECIKKYSNPPTWEKKPPKIEKWCSDIDKLNRIDGIEFCDIMKVIEFSTKHEFWKVHIESGSKLREKYNKLYGQMKTPKKSFKPHGIGFDPSDPEQKAAHDRLMAKWGDK